MSNMTFNEALRAIDKTLINEAQLIDLLHTAAGALFSKAAYQTSGRVFDIVEQLDVLATKLEETQP